MLLTHYLTSTAGIIFLCTSLVSTLPVLHQPIDIREGRNNNDLTDSTVNFANKQRWTQDSTNNLITPLQGHDDTEFLVDLNRLTHLLSAHIMAEHLESAVIALSKSLAAQTQSSVQLITQRSNKNTYQQPGMAQQQSRIYDEEGNNGVDIRLLKEQIQGAVGSYVEDQLPNMWYSHSSFAALDSVSLRSFMETWLLEVCPATTTTTTTTTASQDKQQQDDDNDNNINNINNNVMIQHTCLESHSAGFSTVLDDYVKQNMHSTLIDIVQQDLPQLLVMTDNHIRAVLNHFNSFLLPPHCQLRMNLLALEDHRAWSSVNNINAILDTITEGENSSLRGDSLIHSIHQYAILSKSSS